MTDLEGRDLAVMCNHCGKIMRAMGEWPVQYPRTPENPHAFIVQAIRYICATCKIPSLDFKNGYQVGITILGKAK